MSDLFLQTEIIINNIVSKPPSSKLMYSDIEIQTIECENVNGSASCFAGGPLDALAGGEGCAKNAQG